LFESNIPTYRVAERRKMRWAGHAARMGEMRNGYTILVGKPKGKIQLGRPKLRWEDIINMYLTEIWYEGVDWIHLSQGRDQ